MRRRIGHFCLRSVIPVLCWIGPSVHGLCQAQNYKDGRNLYIPHTDTHFTLRRFGTLNEWSDRRAALRSQILSAAGLYPMPARTPLNAQIFDRTERRAHGFSIEKVLLETMPGYYVGGNLYRPLAPGRYPAILYAHGHHQYGRIEHQHRIHWTVEDEAGRERENRYPDQVKWAAPMFSPPTMAMNLAMQGYVVFTWDMVGYNDTIQTPHTFGGDREKLWSFGPLGLQLWNSTRAADFIQSLPDVDPDRLGMTGASGGGTQTFLLSAVDDRIKAAAPVVMVGGIMQGGSACENAPGLRWGTYNTEIAALIAPRPLLLVGSSVDQSRLTLTEDHPALRSIYALYGREASVEAVLYDAPHNYNRYSREAVYKFFSKHLKPPFASKGLEERSVTVEPPNKLLALHNRTLPSNALSYGQLLEQWIRNARSAAESLSEADLRSALMAALGCSWPSVVTIEGSGEDRVLRRPGNGDRVPAKLIRGRSGAALVVHEKGSAAAAASPAVDKLKAEGRTILLIDAFQTGDAVEPRNFTHAKSRPEDGYYLTFNRSLDANRVQDILTALSFLSGRGEGPIQLVGIGKAAAWTLFAAAVAGAEVSLCGELGSFDGEDSQMVDYLFVPGIQRAGGVSAALRLTRRARLPGCALTK